MISLTKEQMSIFDGLMISDAYLQKGNNCRNARFRLTTSNREFAEKVYNIFPQFPWSNPSIRTRDVFDKRTKKSHSSTVLGTRVDCFFTDQRDRWYH